MVTMEFREFEAGFQRAVEQTEAEMGVRLERWRRGTLTCEDRHAASRGPWPDWSLHAPHYLHLPDLRAQPFWSLADFPVEDRAVFEAVERDWEAVSAEFEAGILGQDFRPTGHTHIGIQEAWSQYPLRTVNEEWIDDEVARVPATVGHLRAIQARGMLRGPVYYAGLAGHLRPHCGGTNASLIFHYPLRVPATDCGIRCGTELRRWRPGKWLILDDAYPHEAWNHSGESRVILLITVPHPDLSALERRATSRIRELLQPTYKAYFSTREIEEGPEGGRS
ncbi:Aspartyl/Asparaginyl beta-hydroxylase [Plesiocystis pacifica SIR-1]|uniref:Aspartyl/Asparaginyl beta-hydroxylase n=2 Tax=Plesiocystis pacifica TaxID=191768 RepID=A6FZR2_9BACT|nr:Aspartyl/Asparaginyl beta-hydroxylase [Plesiocystis pacifica SIR-1]